MYSPACDNRHPWHYSHRNLFCQGLSRNPVLPKPKETSWHPLHPGSHLHPLHRHQHTNHSSGKPALHPVLPDNRFDQSPVYFVFYSVYRGTRILRSFFPGVLFSEPASSDFFLPDPLFRPGIPHPRIHPVSGGNFRANKKRIPRQRYHHRHHPKKSRTGRFSPPFSGPVPRRLRGIFFCRCSHCLDFCFDLCLLP